METPSRNRVLLKVGLVFAAGLLLAIAQFGTSSLGEVVYWFGEPFTSWKMFRRDGFVIFWFIIAILMLVSIALCIFLRRLLWLSYMNTVAFWFLTYCRLAISF